MKLDGVVALVSGANRPNGIGRALVEALIEAGAKKVYATARDQSQLADLVARCGDRVSAIELDITDPKKIADVVSAADDIDLLINNAGALKFAGLIAADDLDNARTEMEVNYFATLSMVRAFAPVLKANGGGVIVNIASISSFVNVPSIGSYSASKAAVHSMTHGVRAELAKQQTRVIGVYPGPVDTDMMAGSDIECAPVRDVANNIVAGIASGSEDIFPDEMSEQTHSGLLSDPKAVEKNFAEMLPKT